VDHLCLVRVGFKVVPFYICFFCDSINDVKMHLLLCCLSDDAVLSQAA